MALEGGVVYLFDMELTDAPAAAAGSHVSVALNCPVCHQRSQARIWNRQWNNLTCPSCRFVVRQFTHAGPWTVDPLTRRIAHVTASQYRVDWPAFGPMGMCLGPHEERRILLCLQFAAAGLAARPVTIHCTARRADSGREVGQWREEWQPCRCNVAACRHNRFVRWLPPADVWDQEVLDCDVRLTTAGGEVLFEDRIRCDISPPSLGTAAGDEADESRASPEPADEPAALPARPPTETEIVDRFHHLYYYGSADEHQVWVRTFWMNVPCIQCPLDLWVYQEILTELRPDLVVETGTLLGGTTLFLAQMLDVIGHGQVISIDLEDLPRPSHPRIEYVGGSSTDSELVRRVFADRLTDETRVVILDSDHSKAHVLAEMRLFARYVSQGGYLVVTDSNVNGHPVFPAYGPGPFEAVEEFLRECDEFQIDLNRQKHKLTFNPNGFLKRVKPAPRQPTIEPDTAAPES